MVRPPCSASAPRRTPRPRLVLTHALHARRAERLLFVDIVRGKLFSYDPATKQNRDLHLKQLIGTVVPCSKELCVVPPPPLPPPRRTHPRAPNDEIRVHSCSARRARCRYAGEAVTAV